jgi:hypothetical protein
MIPTPWIQRLIAIGSIVAGLVLCSAAEAKNVALLVAVGSFADPVMDENNPLPGTVADIDEMQKSLTQRWGFAANDVRVIRDKDATHDRVLAEISGLEQRSAPGDTVLIYFSGHGTSANDEDNQFDLPYATGAWVPYDFDQNSGNRTLIVGRRDLVPRLKALDAAGRWVVVVSDSCFSGQVVRKIGKNHTRYLPMRRRDLGVSANAASAPPPLPSVRQQPPPYPYHHVILLSGASDSEAGGDISTPAELQRWPTFDHKFHGAFTDAFLRLLNGELIPGTFTYAQARDRMNSFLENRNLPQHPQLLPALAEDPQDIGSNQFLTASHAAPTMTAAPAAAAPPRDTIVHVRLDGVGAPLKSAIAALSGVAIVEQGGDMSVRQSGRDLQLLGPAGDPILSTVSGDPKLVQRIAAEAWVNKALPAGGDQSRQPGQHVRAMRIVLLRGPPGEARLSHGARPGSTGSAVVAVSDAAVGAKNGRGRRGHRDSRRRSEGPYHRHGAFRNGPRERRRLRTAATLSRGLERRRTVFRGQRPCGCSRPGSGAHQWCGERTAGECDHLCGQRQRMRPMMRR